MSERAWEGCNSLIKSHPKCEMGDTGREIICFCHSSIRKKSEGEGMRERKGGRVEERSGRRRRVE